MISLSGKTFKGLSVLNKNVDLNEQLVTFFWFARTFLFLKQSI